MTFEFHLWAWELRMMAVRSICAAIYLRKWRYTNSYCDCVREERRKSGGEWEEKESENKQNTTAESRELLFSFFQQCVCTIHEDSRLKVAVCFTKVLRASKFLRQLSVRFASVISIKLSHALRQVKIRLCAIWHHARLQTGAETFSMKSCGCGTVRESITGVYRAAKVMSLPVCGHSEIFTIRTPLHLWLLGHRPAVPCLNMLRASPRCHVT